MDHPTSGQIATQLTRFALKHWKLASLQLSLAVTGTLLMPVFPSVTQRFFDDIIPNQRHDQILDAGLIILGAFFLIEFLFYCRTRVNSHFEQLMIFDLRDELHRKISKMEISWFDKQKTGDLMTRMADDAPATQRVILEGIEQGITAILQIIMAVAVMFHTHAALTWIVLIPTPFIAAGGWIYAKLLSPRETQARTATGRMNSLLFDTLLGIRQLKAFAAENVQQQRFIETSLFLQSIQKKLMSAAALYSPLMTLLGKIGLALVLIVGASWCIGPNASLTSGQLLAFVLLVNMLYEPIARLHSVNQMMIGGFAAAKRVFSLLDNIQQEDYQKGSTQKLQGNISFKQITFGYQPDRPILTNLNLEIQSKQTVAFVGATGSGKSTLFQLLLQFYQPQVGNIMIDGVPINEFNTQHLRQSIAYVSQDSFLFATSIRNNLSLGKLDATDAELWTALTQACADNFVAELPNGLDSDVGERGSQLSGGERQRICIARAFLKNAPILLLDEATSAIDNKNETLIQKALESLKQSRTCLIIAHRLSTVINADNIYVMHQGNIIASGTHQQLLANCSYYAELSRKNLEAN